MVDDGVKALSFYCKCDFIFMYIWFCACVHVCERVCVCVCKCKCAWMWEIRVHLRLVILTLASQTLIQAVWHTCVCLSVCLSVPVSFFFFLFCFLRFEKLEDSVLSKLHCTDNCCPRNKCLTFYFQSKSAEIFAYSFCCCLSLKSERENVEVF